METSGQTIAPAVLPPGKDTGTQRGGLVGPTDGLDNPDKGRKYISSAGFRIDDRPGRSLASVETTLPWFHHFILIAQCMYVFLN